jgi:hypothetical protein
LEDKELLLAQEVERFLGGAIIENGKDFSRDGGVII